jgi:DNA-binding response OmpR family regulator
MKRPMRPQGRIRVLIVDDDAPTREVVRETLMLEDFDFDEAADGDEALRLAKERRPDVVLLDIMMPNVDGYEVCRAIREDSDLAGSFVVMLTAKDQPQDRDRGLAAGANEYLTKPFSPLQLIDTILEVLGGRRAV